MFDNVCYFASSKFAAGVWVLEQRETLVLKENPQISAEFSVGITFVKDPLTSEDPGYSIVSECLAPFRERPSEQEINKVLGALKE